MGTESTTDRQLFVALIFKLHSDGPFCLWQRNASKANPKSERQPNEPTSYLGATEST
jgi:hypothetical protein